MQDDSDQIAADPYRPEGRATASTGDPRVDEVVARLGRLDNLPLDEHVPLYEDLHDELGRVLSDLSAEQDGAAGHPGPAGR
jgi:hypothetical protein